MTKLSSIFLAAILFVSFAKEQPPSQGRVLVTFKNKTSQDFVKLQVNIVGREYSFSDLKKGQTTKPIRVEKSYRYCYAKAITATDTLICQPEDFVGEKLFTKGKLLMTFEIAQGDEGEGWLIIK
jgi:hypothetical protein